MANESLDFQGKIKGEKIYLYLHRHPMAMLSFFALLAAMVVVPIIFIIFSNQLGFNIDTLVGILKNIAFFSNYTPDELYLRANEIIIALFSSYLLFVWAVFLTAFIDYYLDLAIITDKRIIDIEQNRLFSRSVSETYMVDIEDASAKVNGFLQTMFRYGNVFIQTAGTQENFELKDVPGPYEVAKKIIDLHEETVAEQEEVEAGDIGSSISSGEQGSAPVVTKNATIPPSNVAPPSGPSFEETSRDPKDKVDEEKNKEEEKMESMKLDLENFEKQAKEDKPAAAAPQEVGQPEAPPANSENKNGGEISKDELKKGGEVNFE